MLLPNCLALLLQRRVDERQHLAEVVVPELPAMIVAGADDQGGRDIALLEGLVEPQGGDIQAVLVVAAAGEVEARQAGLGRQGGEVGVDAVARELVGVERVAEGAMEVGDVVVGQRDRRARTGPR